MHKIHGETYLLKGSPSTLIYDGDDSLYIIDPGHGGKRAKQLTKIARNFSKPVTVILTHYHSDHLEILSRNLDFPYKIVSSESDKPGIEHVEYRIGMTFGVPMESWSEALMYKATPVEVDMTIKCGDEVGPLKTIHLPGHTPGQIGVLTPDSVLYAGDAVFGERVIMNYLVPYHRDPCKALESLKLLREVDFRYLAPGHGPLLERQEALKLIDYNISVIEEFLQNLIESAGNGRSLHDITLSILAGRKARSPAEYILVEQSIRGGLTCLAGKGILSLDTTVSIPLWKSTSHNSAQTK